MWLKLAQIQKNQIFTEYNHLQLGSEKRPKVTPLLKEKPIALSVLLGLLVAQLANITVVVPCK